MRVKQIARKSPRHEDYIGSKYWQQDLQEHRLARFGECFVLLLQQSVRGFVAQSGGDLVHQTTKSFAYCQMAGFVVKSMGLPPDCLAQVKRALRTNIAIWVSCCQMCCSNHGREVTEHHVDVGRAKPFPQAFNMRNIRL